MAKYVRVLDIRKVETKNGPKAKLQLGKGVEIFVDGKKVDFGEYNSMFLTKTDERIAFLEKMVEEGKMKQENVQKDIEYLESKGISSLIEVKVD